MTPSGDDSLVLLRTPAGDAAAVSLHGAHLLSWRPAGGQEQLYASPLSQPAPGKAVRGGVPVCFPQFADRGPLAKHGFARTSRWELVSPPTWQGDVTEARLQLDASTAGTAWEHAFCLVLCVRLGAQSIEVELQVANTGRTAYAFTGALHTYLRLDDVRDARLQGLRGVEYEDMVDARAVKREGADALRIHAELDRLYRDAPSSLLLEGGGMPPRRITQEGFTDTVVWNPGPQKAATLGDMPAEDWTRMLCVEAAAVHRPVQLAPGKTWRGTQRIALA